MGRTEKKFTKAQSIEVLRRFSLSLVDNTLEAEATPAPSTRFRLRAGKFVEFLQDLIHAVAEVRALQWPCSRITKTLLIRVEHVSLAIA